MKLTLGSISKSIQGRKLSKNAKDKLMIDLNAIRIRLEKGEYETSSITQNIFDVKSATQQFYKHIETYAQIAKSWSSVLSNFPLNKYHEILDICPGFAPKIEIALYYCNYKGNVIVLDKEKESTQELMKFMQLFNPKFKITPLTQNLFSPINTQFSFVIGNHVIDDLILLYFADKFYPKARIYENEKDFIDLWQKILEGKQKNLKEIVEIITPVFIKLVKKRGYLCLAQYKSFMEKMLDQQLAFNFSCKVLDKVVLNLLDSGFKRINVPTKKGDTNYLDKASIIVLKKESS